MKTKNKIEGMIKEKEAAAMIGVTVRTMQSKRAAGTAPKYYKFGYKLIRYLPSEINLWLKQQQKEDKMGNTKHLLVHKKSGKLAIGYYAKSIDTKKNVFLVFDNMKSTDAAELFKTFTEAKKKYSLYRGARIK